MTAFTCLADTTRLICVFIPPVVFSLLNLNQQFHDLRGVSIVSDKDIALLALRNVKLVATHVKLLKIKW